MLYNELPIAFPWYEKIEQQDRYNENVEPVCDYKLISPRDALLPFQFRKPVANTLPILWEVYDINSNNLVANITPHTSLILKKNIEDREYYYYPGTGIPGLSLPPGYFYSRLVFPDGEMYFSEMFHVPLDGAFDIAEDDDIQFMKIEWWNDGDLRPIFYNDVPVGAQKPIFRNVIYLDTFIHTSEPELTSDGTRDGEDELIPTFQKVVIPYRITIVVPDFLKKALMLLSLHEHVFITTKRAVRSGEIRKPAVTSAIEASGALSVVDILFQEDLVMIKKGCGDNMLIQ